MKFSPLFPMQPWYFKDLDYFTEEEVLATGCKIHDVDYRLFIALDRLRGKIGIPFNLHHLTTGIHVEGSYHYKGTAVDGRFLYDPHPNKVIQAAIDCGIKGIGYYRWGWHFDIRQDCALWKQDEGIYLPMVSK